MQDGGMRKYRRIKMTAALQMWRTNFSNLDALSSKMPLIFARVLGFNFVVCAFPGDRECKGTTCLP